MSRSLLSNWVLRTLAVIAIVALIAPETADRVQASAATATTASNCGGAATPTTTSLSIGVDGVSRLVLVHVPAASSRVGPLPLVLNLHGSQSTAAEQAVFSGMDAAADAGGFIVAYPQAVIPSGTGFDWNVPGAPLAGGQAAPKNPPNDVAFLSQLPNDLAGRFCIDRERVYVTGFSGGARMTSQLACEAGNVFAAFAPVSGLRFPANCEPTRPVALLAFHGSADPIDPYNGNGQPYWTESVPAAARQWADVEDCVGSTAMSTPAATALLTTFAGCEAGSAIAYYTIAGLGHEWPGGPKMPKRITNLLGPQSNAVNANAVIWAFFASHALGAS